MTENLYRSMFMMMDEGFCIIERIEDGKEQGSDYRYIAANPAFERHTGMVDVLGKTIRQLVPDPELRIMDIYDEVLRTGQPQRFEAEVTSLNLWMAADVFPVEAPGQLAVLFTNTSDRKMAEQRLLANEARQSFLLGFTDTLRGLRKAGEIQQAASRLLGEHLGVSRAMYAEVQGEGEHAEIVVRGQYARGIEPFPERTPYKALSDGITDEPMRQNETVVVADAASDPRFRDDIRQNWLAAGMAAVIALSVLKDGRVTYIFGVHSPVPRDWTADEIALVEDVADRTWAAAERARSEGLHRAAEEWQAFLLKLSDALRLLDDPLEIQAVAARQLGEYLASDRAYYVEVDAALGEFIIASDWHRPGTSSHVGRYNSGTWSMPWLADGATWIVRDVATDATMPDEQRDAYSSQGVGSLIVVPLLKGDRLLGTWVTNQRAPRNWTAAEIRLVEEVAARTWEAIERARTEAALRVSEERLRAFGEASTDVLWMRDVETLRWTYLTPAFEAIYGMPRDEALAGNDFRNWVDLIVPEDRQHAVDTIQRVRGGENVTFEYRVRRPCDGAIRWLRNTDFPIRNAEGKVTAIGGVGHDASQEKEAERIIRDSRRQLRTLVDGMAQLVWRAIDAGHWTWASPQWTTFTGQSTYDSEGLGWLLALHPDDRGAAMHAWRQTAQTEEPLDVEFRIRQAGTDHYRWFQTRALAVREEDTGKIIEWLGTSTDIHELRQLKDEQEIMVAELQHRTRNLIAVVGSIARETMAQTGPTEEFQVELRNRLEALSRVQGLLSRAGEQSITIRDVLELELDALGAATLGDRLKLEGPDVTLRKSTVQTMALAVHELATNARKYGAMAQTDGELTVRWTTNPGGNGSRRLFLDWREQGVELMAEGDTAATGVAGYGRQLIEKSLPYSLRAKTTYELNADGLRCTIDLPLGKPN